MQSSAAGGLAAIRQFVLSFAILGLLLSPSIGFARGAMADSQTMVAGHHSPCCPQHPAGDCVACAMMGPCALHCLDNVAAVAAMTVMVEESPGAAIPNLAKILKGIEHPPQLRPPLPASSLADG